MTTHDELNESNSFIYSKGSFERAQNQLQRIRHINSIWLTKYFVLTKFSLLAARLQLPAKQVMKKSSWLRHHSGLSTPAVDCGCKHRSHVLRDETTKGEVSYLGPSIKLDHLNISSGVTDIDDLEYILDYCIKTHSTKSKWRSTRMQLFGACIFSTIPEGL